MADDDVSVSRKPGCMGQRHILVICAHVGLILVFCMRVNLSVALVSMVNNSEATQNSTFGQCPMPLINSSSENILKKTGEFQWSRQLQGFILSAFFWGYIVLQIPGGTLAQRYGGKVIFGFGVTWTAVMTLLSPVVARFNVYLFITLRFLEGVGESVTYPAIMAMLGRWSPEKENSFLYTIIMCGGAIGTIIGQITTGPLCDSSFLGGWPAAFYVFGAASFIWLLFWCLLVYDSPDNHPRITVEERRYIVNSNGGNQEQANRMAMPWQQFLSSRFVWVYILCCTVTAWMSYTLLTCLPQFLSDVLHFNITDNAIIASSPYITLSIFSFMYSYICDYGISRQWLSKTNMKKLFTTAALWGVASCFLLITFVSCNATLVVVLLVVGYAFYSGVYAGFWSNALDLSPEYSGTIFGIGNVFSTAAGVVTPLLTDTITVHGTIQEWNIVFYIVSGVTFTGGLVYLIFGSSERQNWCSADNSPVVSTNSETSGTMDETTPLLVNAAPLRNYEKCL